MSKCVFCRSTNVWEVGNVAWKCADCDRGGPGIAARLLASTPPQFRNLKVEPYQVEESLSGVSEDDEQFDVSRFSPYKYVVTFELREHSEGEWMKVRGLA